MKSTTHKKAPIFRGAAYPLLYRGSNSAYNNKRIDSFVNQKRGLDAPFLNIRTLCYKSVQTKNSIRGIDHNIKPCSFRYLLRLS